MSLTSSQGATLQGLATTSATLSILGSSAVLRLNARKKPHERRLNDRLVAVLSALDLCASIGFFIGRLDIHEHDVCQFQGFVIQTFALATVLWNA